MWEEIAFRGIIQGELTSTLSRREGILLTAILFAFMHGNVFSVPYLLVLGLYLGMLKEWSGSLLPPMVVHFAHNLAVVANEWHGFFS